MPQFASKSLRSLPTRARLSTSQLVHIDRIIWPARHCRILRVSYECPIGCEAAFNFRPVDPARPTPFLFGKSGDEQGRIGRRSSADDARVAMASVIGEAVQQPVIDDQMKAAANISRRDVCYIRLKKTNRDASRRCLRASFVERGTHEIKCGNLPAVLCEIDRGIAGAAADIESLAPWKR